MIKKKLRQYFTLPKILALLLLAFLIVAGIAHPLSAQAVAAGYYSDESLQPGMMVVVKKDDATKVQAATTQESSNILGVVVNPTNTPITVANPNQKVFVAGTGQFEALISDQNGPIAPGDYLTISSLNGIGMKASSDQSYVFGKALASFDGKTNVVTTAIIQASNGQSKTVNIGRVVVDITIARNPLAKSNNTNVPDFVVKIAEAVAKKKVSTARLYTSLMVFIVTSGITLSILYAGIRNSIISIGRNPLSKNLIIRGLIQVILVSYIVFLTGIFGVYLLLKI